MKAICVRRLFSGIIVENGEVVDYSVREKKFIVRDAVMHPTMFFNHFKVTEGYDKMSYSDFEYILCNYVFNMAVLFPEEYNGIHNLIIQDWNGKVIMISVNKNEDIIRVSFDNAQEKYSSYEEDLEGIRNHK